MSRTVYLETFGCQMNVLDSELVMSQLRGLGYSPTADRQAADVVLFNTCSVREQAEQKVWSRLGEMRENKTARPNQVIGVMGCLAEREGTGLLDRFPHVDLLCGPGELDKLAGMVQNATTSRPGDLNRQAPREAQVALMGNTSRRSSTLEAGEDNLEQLDLSRVFSPADNVSQAYVRITRGCNKFCTYCVVPYTRGPEVHRPPQNIIDEVRRLADVGTKEVTLLGQTINHYAHQHGDGRVTTFADLLYAIHQAVPHLPRLRFVTSYPRDFTDAALHAMRDCPRICRYLHVPAQHGSNRVLKLMNRGYTIEQYDDFIARAKTIMPDVSLCSDFIVGFPTETDDEFEQTCGVIRRSGFKNSFIFKYSPRPGTLAIKRFEDDVPDAVKRARNNRLLAVQHEVTAQVNDAMVGRTVEVMVEGVSKLVAKKACPQTNVELGGRLQSLLSNGQRTTDNGQLTQLVGRTRGDQIVVFDGLPTLKGELVDVTLTGHKGLTLFAEAAVALEAIG